MSGPNNDDEFLSPKRNVEFLSPKVIGGKSSFFIAGNLVLPPESIQIPTYLKYLNRNSYVWNEFKFCNFFIVRFVLVPPS